MPRGRPHLSYDRDPAAAASAPTNTELVKEFFVAVVNNSGLTLHIRRSPRQLHHIVRRPASRPSQGPKAWRWTIRPPPRGKVPSSKGSAGAGRMPTRNVNGSLRE